MYAGKIVETGSANAVLEPPYHPYTEALLAAIPSPDPALAGKPRTVLRSDTAAGRPEIGCPFHPRCPRKLGPVCETLTPPMIEAAAGHSIVCHIPLKDLEKAASVVPSKAASA
jgi:peptide/nickel transport system ATP-binding protein